MDLKVLFGIIQAISVFLHQIVAAPSLRRRYSRDIKPVGEDREAVVCTVIPESVLQASFPKLVFNQPSAAPTTAQPTTPLPTTKSTTIKHLPYFEYFTTTEEPPEPPQPSRLQNWFSGVLKIPSKISENLRSFWSGYITETVNPHGTKRWTIDVPLPELQYFRKGDDPGPSKLFNFYLQRDSQSIAHSEVS